MAEKDAKRKGTEPPAVSSGNRRQLTARWLPIHPSQHRLGDTPGQKVDDPGGPGCAGRGLDWVVGVAHAPLPGFALFLNLRGLCLTGERGGGAGLPQLTSQTLEPSPPASPHQAGGASAAHRLAKPAGWLPSVRNAGARARGGAPGSAAMGVFGLRGEECLRALQARAKGQWPRRCLVVMAEEMSEAQPSLGTGALPALCWATATGRGTSMYLFRRALPSVTGLPFPPGGALCVPTVGPFLRHAGPLELLYVHRPAQQEPSAVPFEAQLRREARLVGARPSPLHFPPRPTDVCASDMGKPVCSGCPRSSCYAENNVQHMFQLYSVL